MRDLALTDIAPRLSASSLVERLRYRYSQTAEVLKAERLTIAISGGEPERKLFEMLTAPHRLMPLIARKSLGAALVQVPATGDILRGETYKVARKKRRIALSKGFVVKPGRPLAHIDDIMAVNTSAQVRQDRPMDAPYGSKERNIDFFS